MAVAFSFLSAPSIHAGQTAFLFINTYENPIPTRVTVLVMIMCSEASEDYTIAESVAQSVYVDTASCSTVGFGLLVESQEGLETEVCPRADLPRTVSKVSFYAVMEIVPEREPIPVIDLSDDESIEGPEMAPVALGIGLGTLVEEDPSEPTSNSEMMPKPEGVAPADAEGTGTSTAGGSPLSVSPICGYCLWREQQDKAASQQVVALREEISQMDALFYAARQTRRQETARATIPREREILELIDERDWLRQFIAQFLGTTRDSVDRARVELESRPGCSGSQCPKAENMSGSQSPNHADEALSESSQNRQSKPMREATPRLEQATHKVIENFMIKMIELLENSMATRRNEQVPATGVDEALERFLKFRPPEFYGEVE
ncbi:hypothetical protein M9H77_13425 [Catharanthus roseus]|uniref:Uncharacterized protein n=1 Tax=Catharanthus roseus TaxID=4058 RepID=A0ACC0BKE1_CATRO|nr:hypothetical protein M9H77_13425 [Catharanthus roseus]